MGGVGQYHRKYFEKIEMLSLGLRSRLSLITIFFRDQEFKSVKIKICLGKAVSDELESVSRSSISKRP